MTPFEWTLPTRIVFGAGRFREAAKRARGFGKRAFVVTSRSYLPGGARAAVLDDLLAQFKRTGVECAIFGDIEPNPRANTIDRGATRLRAANPRFVVALGGGSVMDAGKCLAMLAVNEGRIYDYAYTGPGRPRARFNHALPLVCIPTVAATSSETDHYAVVTEPAVRRKVTVFGNALQPALSLIDPELTFTVPARQTVDGAFDIITHVMETYLSSQARAPFQDRLTEAVVETVTRALPRALARPDDLDARSELSWCAAFALSGSLSGRDGSFPVHALEHGLSAWTDLAHGRGLAMLLPRKMAFDSDAIPEKTIEFNRRIFGVTGASSAIEALRRGLVVYMKDVGAWTRISEIPLDPALGVNSKADLIEKTIAHAMEVDAVLKHGQAPFLENIRPIRPHDARAILDACDEDGLGSFAPRVARR